MNNDKYAPVLIVTLNRHEHFQRCLESIEACINADKTDVYIALDYPPSEKYVDGWKQINSYLNYKEQKNGFKSLNVIRRQYNYGIGKKKSNLEALIDDISINYDCYITTEDDNVFSRNSLVYFNAMLNKYKHDERISRISGYNYDCHYPSSFRENYFLSPIAYPWGNGSWVDKRDLFIKYLDLNVLRNIVRDKKTRRILKSKCPHTIYSVISMIKRNSLYGDSINEICMALEDKYYVIPTISKIRNYGNDGTGAHSLEMHNNNHNYFSNQKIDNSDAFIPSEKEVILNRKDIKQLYDPKEKGIKSIIKFIINRIDLFLLIYFNFVPKSKYI